MINNNDLEKELWAWTSEEQVDEQVKKDNEANLNEELDDALLDEDLLEGEWVKSLDELRKQQQNKWVVNKILYWLVAILFIAFMIVLGVYYFLKLSLSDKKAEGFEQEYMNLVDTYILKNISNEDTNFSVSSLNEKNVVKLKKFMENKWVFFYKKQDLVSKITGKELNLFNKEVKNIEKVKKILIKYRFLPKELSEVLEDIKITPILLTLSSIKLYITDYVYLKTGKFEEYVLSYVKKYNPAYSKLDKKLKGQLAQFIVNDIQSLRELWVKTYLSDIVFNYMYIDPNKYWKVDKFANNYFINDFYNNYKNVLDKTYLRAKKINPKISKKEFIWNYIMVLASVYNRTNELFSTLEPSSLPVDINLLSYEPKDQTLSFNVKISLKEWETRISVVKLATNIITLLRESRLIIWENINFDNLKVTKLIIRTPNGKKVYDTTNLIFKTSVQNSVNVEVTDVTFGK